MWLLLSHCNPHCIEISFKTFVEFWMELYSLSRSISLCYIFSFFPRNIKSPYLNPAHNTLFTLQSPTSPRPLAGSPHIVHRSSPAAPVFRPYASAADHRATRDQNCARDQGPRCWSQVPTAARSYPMVQGEIGKEWEVDTLYLHPHIIINCLYAPTEGHGAQPPRYCQQGMSSCDVT